MKHFKNNNDSDNCNCAGADGQNCDADQCATRIADDMCANEQALNIDSLDVDFEAKFAEANIVAEKNKDLYVRALADLDNYRRKVQREKQELAKFALQPLIEELLPTLDHLEMAINAARASNDSENIVMGVDMVCSQMKKVLANFGVEEISAVGKDFDPNLEDCVSHEASESFAENKVIKVIRRGYVYNGRLIRPASVVVSSGKSE